MIDHVRTWVQDAGPAGPLVFIAAYVLLTVLLFPGSLASVLAGALFGSLWGTIWTLIGATLGAAAAYEVARMLGRERVARRLGPRTTAVDAWVAERGMTGVIALRLVPVLPFNALNYALGLSGVSRRHHGVGTAIGIIPGTIASVSLGASLSNPTSSGLFISLAAVGALTMLSVWRSRRLASSLAPDSRT